MAVESIEFKYALGDVLVPKAALTAPVGPAAPRLLVVERFASQCPGGTQITYRCRPYACSPEGGTLLSDLVPFNEIELGPWEEYVAKVRAHYDELARLRDENRSLTELCATLRDELAAARAAKGGAAP